MAEISPFESLEADLMLAERVELLVSSDATNDTAGIPEDRLVSLRSIRLSSITPEVRFNHGTIRTYGHGSPDLTLRFVISVSAPLIAYLQARSIRPVSSNVLPIYRWAVKVTSVGGSTKIISFKGKLLDKEYDKEDGEQGNAYEVECLVRIIDESLPSPI